MQFDPNGLNVIINRNLLEGLQRKFADFKKETRQIIEDVLKEESCLTAREAMVYTPPMDGAGGQKEVVEEKTTFDVILEDVPSDKRVPVLKIIRNLTSLDLKEAKESITSLPKTIQQGVSKEDAEAAKQQLEEAGAKVKIA
jgi:large subunit ribosomal protein L7/L12